MALIVRLGFLVCLASTLALAETWSGALVDSKCFDGEERNVGPTDSLSTVDRDRGEEIRFCSPNGKTKLFAVIGPDGQILRLDAGGNTRARELVQKTGKRPYYIVAVTGELNQRTVKVDSISMARTH